MSARGPTEVRKKGVDFDGLEVEDLLLAAHGARSLAKVGSRRHALHTEAVSA